MTVDAGTAPGTTVAVNGVVTYTCNAGHFLPAVIPLSQSVTATCQDTTFDFAYDTTDSCVEMCSTDPPNVNNSTDDRTTRDDGTHGWFENTVVT